MIHKKLILLFSLHFLLIPFLLGQEVGIGEWRDHLPYVSGISVTEGNNNIYCATPYSVFYFNKADNSLNRITTISGLNDIGISKIGYNQQENTLVIAYENTNIDLIKGNVIINMADIFNSTAITPEEKTINNLLFIDNLAYLSCGFGIVVININKEEVVDTYYIGPNGSHLQVFDLTYTNDLFYAATENGIYTADRDNPNLAYFGTWSKDQTLPSPNAEYSHITLSAGVIYTNKHSQDFQHDTIFYMQNGTWQKNPELFGDADVRSMKSFDDELYIAYSYSLRSFDSDLNNLKLLYSYFPGSVLARDILVDNGKLWIADFGSSLVKEDGGAFEFYVPNGPNKADVFDMSVEGDQLWAVAGGRNLSWGNLWSKGNASSLINGTWNTFDHKTEGSQALDSILDLVCVAVNPYNIKQVFAGSWYLGLVEFNDEEFDMFYNPENSSLGYKANEGPPICKIGGLAFDKSGNLWMTNSGANNILSVRINDGSELGDWRSFYLGSASTGKDIGKLIIDSYGQKWIIWRDHSIIVFNDGGTPTDPSDDQVKQLTSAQNNGALPGTKIFSIAEDLDGEIWIGTDEGIAVIYSPENVFTQYNYDAQRILIPRNDGSGLADILLEFETITDIKIDGDNKKWIGTDRSGVYLISSDGIIEYHHFTTGNSPLLSDNITSIAVNGKNGEVFFGTANGIISFKGRAVNGGTTNNDVYAYPNPVRPGYTGLIAVKGLVENAYFKITDINGALVYSGQAEGGQAIWDGNNFSGRRAQSGVYLVFITNETGSETLVTKILFMN